MDNKEFNELQYIIDQTYASLMAVSNKLQTAGDSYSGDLTSKQLLTLLAILHIPEGDATIINISGKLGTTKQNATRIIKSLEKKKYISVMLSENDKRAVNVVLTEVGIRSLSKNAKYAKKNFMNDIFNDFNKEELETLWKLLKKLYSYDGVPMDGFEEKVKIPNISAEVLE
ncbi:MarR family winged helix-turn-helix transcriptional regulator [Clostridium akagii]|uniref:MarR family winged helix-turn-helix transcriptional regulator n=1 Tax=Clostridium akagii TaxID=91623 RepID=UPI0005691FCB|nr:MarR family transcriptional regulator [Clostridium akagii]